MTHPKLHLLVLDDATIRSLLTYPAVIGLVEAAFAADARGQAHALPVVSHGLNGGNYSIKTSHVQATGANPEVFGLKMGSYFPGNTDRDLPTHSAAMLLGDPLTGQPRALLAANAITEYRTAAAGAVAARHLAREDAAVVALFGTGAQARAQLDALRAVRSIREVRVWSRDPRNAERFAREVQQTDLAALAFTDGREACAGADIIVTITPAREPLVYSDWAAPGTHVNAMGSDAPGKGELDPALVARARVVGKRTQSAALGELQVPVARRLMTTEDVHAELGELCAGVRPGRGSASEVTVFDSTGVSFQDTIVAGHLLRLVGEQGVPVSTVTL